MTAPAYQMKLNDWEVVQALPGNNECIDCSAPSPEWASVSYGILMCLQCSGIHRSLGTHVSFVRSIKMDSWSDNQVQSMILGGNHNLTEFLESKGIRESGTIREKYDNDVAQLYKLQLRARVDQEPIPEKLPLPPKRIPVQSVENKYQGFGSSPPPPHPNPWFENSKWLVPIVVGISLLIIHRS